MDKFGRKKIILIKVILCTLFLIPLLIIGFIGSGLTKIVLPIFFFTLFWATFTFDILCIGFEKLPKSERENFIILLSATRFVGIGIICVSFYYLKDWVYFICIEVGLLIILGSLFMKYTFESPHHVLASTANIDTCKYILNSIALINEEDTITDKIAFSQNPQSIKRRRTTCFMLKNLFSSRSKLFVIGVLSICWLAYWST